MKEKSKQGSIRSDQFTKIMEIDNTSEKEIKQGYDSFNLGIKEELQYWDDYFQNKGNSVMKKSMSGLEENIE